MKNKEEVEKLLKDLTHKDSRIRKITVEILGRIGDRRAVEPLIHTLEDEAMRVRWRAAEALGVIGDPKAVAPLIQTLADPAFMVRRKAAQALGRLNDPTAGDRLANTLKDNDAGVRSIVANTLNLLDWTPKNKTEKIYYLIAMEDWNRLVELGTDIVTPLIQNIKDEDLNKHWNDIATQKIVITTQKRARKTKTLVKKGSSYKIVFGSGGSEGGVSTILRTFLECQPPRKNDRYNATIDYERIELDYAKTRFIIFDLGNQTAFLDRFVTELKEFIFAGVHVLVFVVESTRVQEYVLKRVREYFEKMITHLHTYSPTAKVFVFLNKWDLVPQKLAEELYNEVKSYLFKNIDPSYLETNVRVYKTSVFNKSLTKPMLDLFGTAITGEFL